MGKFMTFDSKITSIEQINPLFSKVEIQACYAGVNRNNSFLTKDSIDEASPTAIGCPIVGRYIKNKQDFGDHGGEIVVEDGQIIISPTTIAYGFTNESAEISWKPVEDDEGNTKDYFCITGLLWTSRFPELQSILDEPKGQSMEIEILDSEFIEVDGQQVENIKKFRFTGFCILGDDVEPCFEEAKIMAFSKVMNEFKDLYQQMISEYQFSLRESTSKTRGETMQFSKIEIDNSADAAIKSKTWTNPASRLWNKLLEADNAESLVKEAYLIVDDGWKDHPSESLHYPHHSVKDGELVVNEKGLYAARARLMQNNPDNQEAKDHLLKHYKELGLDTSDFEEETVDESKNTYAKGGKSVAQNFSYTSEQLEDELRRLLSSVVITGDYWNYSRFWYQDSDETNVYAFDYKNNFTVGMPYTVEGDKVSIDTEKMFRVKFSPSPLDLPIEDHDGDDTSVLANFARKFAEKQKEKDDEDVKKLQAELEDYKSKLDAKEQEYNDLKQKFDDMDEEFAKTKEEMAKAKEDLDNEKMAKKKEQEDQMYQRFSALLSSDEINTVREWATSSNASVEQIESKLFELNGKKTANFSFNKSPYGDLVTAPIFNRQDNGNDDPYGGLLSK